MQTKEIESYFLTLWRRRKTLKCEEVVEEPPTFLVTVKNAGSFAVVGRDKLSVSYGATVDLNKHNVGVVQGNRPAPSRKMLYYFEIYVKNAGEDAGEHSQIAIGFTLSDFIAGHHPGLQGRSTGYLNCGSIYSGRATRKEISCPDFTTGDTVGGGINYNTQEFFFTKNGVLVGSVNKHFKGPMFPTVSVHNQSHEVTVNFGKQQFVFDLENYESESRRNEQLRIDSISISEDPSHVITRSYLQHYGYEEPLKLLDREEDEFNEEESMHALSHRSTLRQLIRQGEIDDTFSKLGEWYPQIVQDDTSTICFLLHCQKFIELVRVGKLEDAVLYGRNNFSKFKRVSEVDDVVKDCYALLAYEQPDKSSVGYLVRESQKELLADAVNAMVLFANVNLKEGGDATTTTTTTTTTRIQNEGGTAATTKTTTTCMHSRLERLIRQLGACYVENRRGEGEAFHLGRILNIN